MDYINEHQEEIDELIVHAAFQFIFQDRKFLHDFHLELSAFIQNTWTKLRSNIQSMLQVRNGLNEFTFRNG